MMKKGPDNTTARQGWEIFSHPCGGLSNSNYSAKNDDVKCNCENNFVFDFDKISEIDLFDDNENNNTSSENCNNYLDPSFEEKLNKYTPEIPYFYYDYIPKEIEEVKSFEKQAEFLYHRILNEPFGLGFLRSKVKYDKYTGKPTRYSVRKHYKINPFTKGNKFSDKFKKVFADLYIKNTPFKETAIKLKEDGIIKDDYPYEVSKIRFHKFVNKCVNSTSDAFWGVGYINPLFFDDFFKDTKAGLGAILRKNASVLEYFIFWTNPNNFITPFLFSGIVDGEIYGYLSNIPVSPRNRETAFIPQKSKYGFLLFDIDITDNKNGLKIINEDKKSKAIVFINILAEIFNNVFVRYSRSGLNYHILILFEYDDFVKNRTLYMQQIFELAKSFKILIEELPYDQNTFDYTRLFFGSPYPFIPVKFNNVELAGKLPIKFMKAIERFLQYLKNNTGEDIEIIKQKIKEVYMFIMTSKNLKELKNRVNEIRYEYKVRNSEIKIMNKLNAKKMTLETPTKDEILKRLNKFKKSLLLKKEKHSFFYLSFEALKMLGIDVSSSKNGDYYKFRISPNEKTPYDVYLYYNDVRFFYLQSENSIRHLPEEIIFVKLSNGQFTKLIPYSEYKDKSYKYNKYISVKFVIPNYCFDILIETAIKNFYGIDVELSIIKLIASRVSKRNFEILQALKTKLLDIKNKFENKEINRFVVDLKCFGSRKDRYYTGINDLIDLIQSCIFPEEILGLRIVYTSSHTFEIEILSEKGLNFLLKTLEFMQIPLFVNSYIFDNEIIKINDDLNGEIMNFAYKIYRKGKLGAVATSLGYNPKHLFYLLDIMMSGKRKITLEDLTYDKLFILFLVGYKVVNSFDRYVINNNAIKFIVKLYDKVFGNNIFEVNYEHYEIAA